LRPRVVRRLGALRDRVVEDEPLGALRIRGREQQAHRGCLERSEEDRALRPECVEHRAEVVHARLEGRRLAHPVREAGTAPVEHDVARERGKPVVEGAPIRTLELEVEVAGEAMDSDEVNRPVTQEGVSDRDVTASGVTDVRRLHQHSLARPLVVWRARWRNLAANRIRCSGRPLPRVVALCGKYDGRVEACPASTKSAT
jgi:hypothetical protein